MTRLVTREVASPWLTRHNTKPYDSPIEWATFKSGQNCHHSTV